MPSNLEIKVKLDNFDEILTLMDKNDCHYTTTLEQKDIYYKNKRGLLKLRMQQKGNELIFYNRDEVSSERRSDYTILPVSDEAEGFFNNLFETDIVVQKVRELFMYKNTRIHLDTVKNLGLFLELEAVVTGSIEEAAKEYNFLNTCLGLNRFQSIRKSYSDLLREGNK